MFKMRVDKGSMERRKGKVTSLIISFFLNLYISELTVIIDILYFKNVQRKGDMRRKLRFFWKLISVAVVFLPFSFAQNKRLSDLSPIMSEIPGQQIPFRA